MPNEKLSWDTVVKVTAGRHRGRIGYYDDDDDYGKRAVVYFGDMLFGTGYYLIPHRYLAPVTTSDLIDRRDEIFHAIGIGARGVSDSKRVDLLTELGLIADELFERLIIARFKRSHTGKRVFISHSSADKQFALYLATELGNAGHSPWFDDWKIQVGESIPSKISDGIKDCDAVVVILSEHAVKSRWVENEWQAKYWDEIAEGKIRVLPALLKPCKIPTLLKTKKYADFTESYNRGLEELLFALADGQSSAKQS